MTQTTTARRRTAGTFSAGLFALVVLAGFWAPVPASAMESPPAATTGEASAPVEPARGPELDSEAAKAAMRAAVGPDGAQMGQGTKLAVQSRLDAAAEATWVPSFGVKGQDVSSHQTGLNWQQQWNMGSRFAYVKATEGNYYVSDSFSSQYLGARNVGMIRGAYHFAIPNASSGADQARFFVANGGGWTGDGYTMPPVLDFEFNPYAGMTINGFYHGNTCYDKTPQQLASWVRDFGNTMRSLTGRLPVIYTNTGWWKQCTGDALGFGDYPLWVANYPTAPSNDAGPVPSSWNQYSIWQFSPSGPFAGDSNVWNGSYAQLQAFARNGLTSAGAIERKWVALGGASGSLGAAISQSDICNLVGGGCYRSYAAGNIYWTSATGAHAVTGSYWKAWGAVGWQSAIGYPTGDVTCPYGSPASSTCHQTFQGGIVYATPGVGTFAVANKYMSGWKAAGWQQGIGYPTAAASCGLYGGGCYQPFQKGNIYFTASTGAHAVTGSYWNAWKEAGWQQGLGYPTGPTACGLYGGGCYQPFQKANVYFSSTTGAHAVFGAYFTSWKWAGWQAGVGYPTGPVKCGLYGGGCYQPFERATSYYTAATGANMVGEPYWSAWGAAGWQPRLGYPLGVAVKWNGYREVPFQGGSITYSANGVTVRTK
ncbi:GH25 family lysozyme M1 (1,4-beta-N-acetylmuramidase) [Arthrobacter globiformis]|nr:GH25 family lysozyme M1 (1,4-beta-N-acetylmuramidase) [Arthrobacter globiformis]